MAKEDRFKVLREIAQYQLHVLAEAEKIKELPEADGDKWESYFSVASNIAVELKKSISTAYSKIGWQAAKGVACQFYIESSYILQATVILLTVA